MNISKKIVSIALAVATFGFAVSAPAANAQSTADLQAQIAALLAQITQLQAQLGGSTGGSTSYNFTRDLTVGSKGDDVSALQQFLIGKGLLNISAPTGFFGSMTKAALASFQASVNLTPSVGYFGPKTRAYLNSTVVVTPPGQVPASGLAVSVASNNPTAGSLISSPTAAAARVAVLAVNLTAGSASGITVNELKFKKNGVLSDSSIAGAYLVESGKVLAQYASLSNGVITFNGLGMNIAAGQSRNLTLAIDPVSNLSAGNTVSFGIAAASDVVSVNASNAAVTASGMFPVNGNTFTVTSVTNPSIASVTFTSSTVGTSVFAGTQNVLVSQWSVTTNNSPVNLASLNFRVTGSANKGDIKNVKLMVNGAQVGSAVSQVAADGSAYFDLTSAPARLNTGTTNIQVLADVMGSPSYDFRFQLLNSYDVYAIDTQYNVPVSVTLTGGSGTNVTIQAGQITVSLASDSPTSNIALGASNTTLSKINIYAAGEALRVRYLRVQLVSSGGTLSLTSSTVDTHLRNLSLVDDAGVQIGSTISSLNSGSAVSGSCAGASATSTICYFGTSASPINYVVPANTTRVVSVKVDVQSTASFTTLQAILLGETGGNLQGVTSSATANSGQVSAASRTLSTTPLTVSKNGAMSNATYAAGASNVRVGSYVFTASSAEGVNISNFTISTNASSSYLQNLTAKVGSAQVGNVYSTISASNYTFSGNINVPAGGTAVVDIYANVLSSASGALASVTSFVSCTGTGAATFSSVSCGGTPAGQTLTISSGSTLTVGNNGSLGDRQVRMGTTGVSLAKISLTDTAGIEPIRVQSIKFGIATGASVGQAFGNLVLKQGGTTVAGPVSITSAAPTFVANFDLGSAATIVVPQAGSLQLELFGDITGFDVGSNVQNTTSTIAIIATSSVTAYGQSSNTSVTVSGSPTFAMLTALRSKLTLSGVALAGTSCGTATGLGSANPRGRTATDNLACLTLTPDGPEVTVQTLALRFSGAAVSTASTFTVDLIDPSTGANYDGSGQKTCSPTGSSCAVTFSFSGTAIYSAKSVIVRVVSTNFGDQTSTNDSLDLTLNARTDVSYGNGSISGATASGLNLSSDVIVPMSLANVSYN